MRTFVILLAATTGLLGLGYAFQANATMGVLQPPAATFSPVERADCRRGIVLPEGLDLAVRSFLHLLEMWWCRSSGTADA